MPDGSCASSPKIGSITKETMEASILRKLEPDMLAMITGWVQAEFTSFIKVWLLALFCLSYCYFAAKILPKGAARLVAFLPVAGFFLLTPFQVRFIYLQIIVSLLLSWVATVKVCMFAFDNGPLSDPSLSLPKFLSIGCLPIKIKFQNGDSRHGEKRPKLFLNYAIKVVLLLAMVFVACTYADHIHPKIALIIYGMCIYLPLEILLAVVAAMTRSLLGVEMEPQFDEPYLSTSLQDFWGKRWNLVASRMFYSAVYVPVRKFSAAIIGPRWAALPAVMATFWVSGLMHELSFFQLGCPMPTRAITWFFLLHGACLAIEIGVKKRVKLERRFPRVASIVLTDGFIIATALWLILPQILWCKQLRANFTPWLMQSSNTFRKGGSNGKKWSCDRNPSIQIRCFQVT
ncbi:acyl-CoA--sterol O-acyltransferase 1-like [Andrographis paniculata]|uniref:acyl-CoA--sterol O-acyltransferase 1-like n=1 Tax=Andrographis paniculata TaxID=175694 RepID=UPI0021E95288|nr:acyl-CoA--sterol O-acyltransferase 1-like [Andrographis paniculata]